jgi:hypothetical protein
MKYIAGSSLAILFFLYSCGALKHVTFYETFNEPLTIPAATLTGATDTFVTPAIVTNVESQLQANNTSSSLVQSVELQTMTLSITTPPGQTFAALQDMRVFILTDSLPAVEIANQYNISSTSDTLNMNVDNVQLKQYLLSNSFEMKFITTTNTANTSNMTLNVFLKFQFQANLLAAL